MMTTMEILQAAVKAKSILASLTSSQKKQALLAMAEEIDACRDQIVAANQIDIENAKGVLSDAMIDRLTLTDARLDGMTESIRIIADQPDPVGRILSTDVRPNGLQIEKTAVPFGVIAMIYESRPNVTSDAAALAFASGNVCVLRGGKEAFHSSNAIATAMRSALKKQGICEDCIALIQDLSRQSAADLMSAVGYVDLLIPRGGKALIDRCVSEAKVPCIQTGTGICHVYVDKDADLEMALSIVENAKASRPSVCNAAEVCLVHKDIAEAFLPTLQKALTEIRQNQNKPVVELRLDEKAATIIEGIKAGEQDFDTEFLDYILAVKVVDDVHEAVAHIATHSTGHSESIITENKETAKQFTMAVDSSAVYVNASTRFTDGGEFGFGGEIGISTQRLHGRGPIGLNELTTYKYIITGNGQIR
jgi:glutamate-5-semialdehyde dehydrogenase